VTDDRMANVVQALNHALFDGRLSKRISVAWHDTGPNAGATLGDQISLHTDLLTQSRAKLFAVLVHELAHIATKNETEPHGIRWRSLMYRLGVEPDGGRVRHGGPLDLWIRSLP
jgi:predicted SprT family Zn-dependent metalloprotease